MKLIIPGLKQCITSQKEQLKYFEAQKRKNASGVTEKFQKFPEPSFGNSIIQLEISVSFIDTSGSLIG